MSLTPVPTGNDVQVNIYTTDQQLYPSVTALSDGGFVVTWTSDGQDGSGTGIYGQHYTADGTAVGSEFRVNTYTTSSQLQSSVTALSDGGFLVTWNSSNQDGNSTGIYGQRYAANSTAVGGEFRANTYTASIQGFSSATALSDGGFVVTWSSFLQDGSSYGIYGQRFAANGAAVGSEFRANTHTTSEQQFSSVTGLSGGGFVVTWESLDQDGDNYGIYGQRYASDGTAIGGEFQVNSYTTSFQQSPSVAALSDGGFLVTWSSSFQDGSSSGIYGQRYSADGTAVGTEFRANTYTASHQIFSSVSALPDGGFVVTWTSNGQDGDSYGIYGQRYAADGTAVGTEYRANQVTAGMQIAQTFYGSETVAALGDGRLVQVWAGQGAEEVFFRLLDVPSPPVFTSGSANSVAENAPTSVVVYDANATDEDPVTYSLSSGGDNDLFAIDAITGEVRFKASPDFEAPGDADGDNVYDIVVHASDGSLEATKAVAITVRDVDSSTGLTPIPLGNDVQVNTYTASNQTWPSVAALSDGGFVVTWSSFLQDGSGYGSYGQRYASDGTAIGSEFRANTYTTDNQLYPSVATLSDGGFVVTWSSFLQDGSNYGIYGQRYASDGTAIDGEFQVNTHTTSDQIYSSVTALSDGGFVVTWSSSFQDGSSYGIYGQRYASDGTAIGAEFRANSYTTSDQFYSSVTALSDGGFVVTWSSFPQDGSSSGIYGQRYASDGTAIGTEFQVNSYTTSAQQDSSVATLSDGGFVVTWSSSGQDGSSSGIYGQRYASDGTAVGSEFRANSYTPSNQLYSSVAALSDGGFVVTWSSNGQDGSGYGIYGQRYAPDGTAIGDEFRLNQITAGNQVAETLWGSETVAALGDGRLVQVWSGNGSEEVFFRLLDVSWGDNGLPVITSNAGGDTAAVSVAEGTTSVTTVTVEDPDAEQTLTYSLAGGADEAAFTIDGTSGVLSFVAAPDFETPADLDQDNIYEVVVEVSDGAGGIDSQAISVTVADVNTAPTITSGTTGTVAENAAIATVVYDGEANDDGEDSGTLTYALAAGGDNDLFAIDAGTGEVTFLASPDYETPADADGDNVYEITVEVSDGALSDTQAVSITVTDQNDTAPVITTEAELSVAENTLVVAALSSTDVDTVGTEPAQFSISGGADAALFEISGSNLVFKSAPDYETDPHSYEVEVTASDGVNQTTKLLTITLTDLSGVIITGTAGNDTVDATTTVPGQPLPTEEDDVIYGLAGADNLNGLAGNDRIDGGPGADVMTGGPGDDTYVVDDPLDEVTELEDEGIDEVESAIAYTLGSHVERLTLTGNQAIDGTGNSLNNRIIGNAMANRIDGGAGQDDMAGRGGDDTYLVDHELDTITEEAAGGTDTVISTAFLFTLPDEVENLTLAMGAGDTFGTGNDLANVLLGNAGINTLVGNGGGDTLDGGAGADYLLGGVGNDFYRVDDTFDLVDEGGAFPAYAGSALDFDTLSSTAEWFWDVYSVGERLVIEEGAVGSDGAGTTIVGSVFSNEMIGNSGTNIMFGRGGSDTYRAGDGGDWISLPLLGVTDENAYLGVDGPNTIIVDARTTGAFSYDIIFEFESGKDKIDVSDFGYATATEVFLRGHDDGFGNSYYALGDGLDYVYLVGLTVGQLSVLDFVV